MVSLVSGEASAHGHLHLDPTLEVEVPVDAKCDTCCPIKAILRKIFCCFSSNCCNKTIVSPERVIYCQSDGQCVPFDYRKSQNPRADYTKTADRVKSYVGDTPIDLVGKSDRGEPLTLREIKMIQKK